MTTKYLAPGADLGDAVQIRTQVFIEEQGFTLAEEFDEKDPLAYHVVLYKEGMPVATSRFFADAADATCFLFGRIAVVKAQRKTGLGRQLLLAMEEQASQLGATRFWLGAQRQAEEFYEKAGYQPCGAEYMDGHVPHIPMDKRTPKQRSTTSEE